MARTGSWRPGRRPPRPDGDIAETEGGHRSPLSPLAVAAAAIVLAAGAVTWSAYDHATHQHADAVETAGSDLRHHAQAAAQTLDMLAQGIAMATTDVAERLGDQAFPEATNPARVHDLLRRKLADLPQVSRLSVVDATGAVVSDSLRHPPMEPPVGPPPLATDLFKGHPDRWVGLLPAGAEPARLMVGRPVRGEDGTFRGMVVAEVDGAVLRDSLWTTSGAQIDGLAVIDQSGTVVTARSGDPSARPPAPGTPLTADHRFQGLPALLGQGSGIGIGEDRLHAVHPTSTLPLRVVATQRLDVPLDAWRAGTLVPALVLAGGSWAAGGLLIAVLAAQARQNRRVRRELRDSEARLDQLVEASPAVIYETRLDDGFNATSFSRNLALVLGYDAAEAQRTPDWWVSHIHPDDRDRVLRDASLWLESGAAGTYGHRYRFRAADGTWRWMEDQMVAVRDGDGRVRNLIGSLIDISEAMEGAARLSKLAGNVPGMIFQFRRGSGTVSTFPYCSDGIRDILGLSPADVAVDGDLALDLVHPDDRPAVERSMSESRHSLSDWNGEFRVLHPQRGEIWVAGHAKPEPQSDGAVLWHGYLSEVTLRKKAQQALEASEERLGLILRGANDAPWDWDLVADTMYYAPRWWDMLGLEVGSLPGGPRLWQELLHPDDAARMAPVIQETFADPSKDSFEVEFRLRHRDGHYVPVLSRGIILRDATGTPYRLAGANTDLTERRALEHALADSERLYRSIFENVSDAIFLVGIDGGPGPDATFRFLRSNPADQRATGLNGIGGLPPHAFLPADIADQVTRRYADCLAAGAPVIYEETVALPAGRRVWSTTLNPVRDDSGAITLLVGISRDITDAKRSERLIRESEERLATYFRLAPLGIYIADAAGRYQEVNAAACAQSGFTAAEFKAMSIPDYVVPEAVGEGLAHFERVFEAGISHGEVRLRRKDGSWFWGMVVAGALPDGRVIAFVEDITERKRTEDSLHRSNADLEQFAYVASHDLRQPLRMVNSYLQLVARRLGPTLDNETAEFITYARDGAKRMDEMLVALLEFSRVGRTGLPMMPVHSGEALEEALRFLGPTIAETDTQVRREGSWPTVLASRDELVRLFQNLIDNAMKYRPADATPTITLVVDRADDGWRFQITDNGIGIPADQIPRLFKVFQRLHTREEFDGTGIGLAVCRKIVERHGGRIWVDSAGPGSGSTFGFTLPATVAVTDLVEG